MVTSFMTCAHLLSQQRKLLCNLTTSTVLANSIKDPCDQTLETEAFGKKKYLKSCPLFTAHVFSTAKV